jgi:hypothetical protein
LAGDPLPSIGELERMKEASEKIVARFSKKRWKSRPQGVEELWELGAAKADVRWAAKALEALRTRTRIEPLLCDVQGIRIGRKIGLVGIQGEVFTNIGRRIKERIPYDVMVVGNANGSVAYLPDRAAFRAGKEGYETRRAARWGGNLVLPSPRWEDELVKGSVQALV